MKTKDALEDIRFGLGWLMAMCVIAYVACLSMHVAAFLTPRSDPNHFPMTMSMLITGTFGWVVWSMFRRMLTALEAIEARLPPETAESHAVQLPATEPAPALGK